MILEMTARPFLDWFEEALPALIFQHIIQAQAVKVCSSISPIFGVIARRYGYEAYVLPAAGHVLNVVVTPEGPLRVDLSAIQFQICNFLRDEDITEQDPYGTRGSVQRLIRHIIRDPRRAVSIDRYYGSMKNLRLPDIEPFTQHYL